jgi:hypothetical protein
MLLFHVLSITAAQSGASPQTCPSHHPDPRWRCRRPSPAACLSSSRADPPHQLLLPACPPLQLHLLRCASGEEPSHPHEAAWQLEVARAAAEAAAGAASLRGRSKLRQGACLRPAAAQGRVRGGQGSSAGGSGAGALLAALGSRRAGQMQAGARRGRHSALHHLSCGLLLLLLLLLLLPVARRRIEVPSPAACCAGGPTAAAAALGRVQGAAAADGAASPAG